MQGKKILATTVILLAIAGAVVFFVLFRKSGPQLQAPSSLTQPQQQSLATGELGTVPVVRNVAPSVTDQTQPYATNLPRSDEPARIEVPPAAGGGAGQSDQTIQQRAIAEGLLPDQNGQYVQNVHPSGMNTFMTSSFEAGLNNDQYLAKYFPQSRENIRNFQSGNSGGSADALALYTPPQKPAGAENLSVPEVSGVDRKLFNVTTQVNKQAYSKYIKDLNTAVSDLDLIKDQNILVAPLQFAGDRAKMEENKSKAQLVSKKILSIPVSKNLLGLSQAYYDSYQKYISLLDDAPLVDLRDASSQSRTAGVDRIEADISALLESLRRVNDYTAKTIEIFRSLGYVSDSRQ